MASNRPRSSHHPNRRHQRERDEAEQDELAAVAHAADSAGERPAYGVSAAGTARQTLFGRLIGERRGAVFHNIHIGQLSESIHIRASFSAASA